MKNLQYPKLYCLLSEPYTLKPWLILNKSQCVCLLSFCRSQKWCTQAGLRSAGCHSEQSNTFTTCLVPLFPSSFPCAVNTGMQQFSQLLTSARHADKFTTPPFSVDQLVSVCSEHIIQVLFSSRPHARGVLSRGCVRCLCLQMTLYGSLQSTCRCLAPTWVVWQTKTQTGKSRLVGHRLVGQSQPERGTSSKKTSPIISFR